MDYKELSLRSHSLVVFDGLLTDPVVATLQGLLDAMAQIDTLTEDGQPVINGMREAAVAAYGAFTSALYEQSAFKVTARDERDDQDPHIDLSEYLSTAVLEDENFYVKLRARKAAIPPEMEKAVHTELTFFETLCGLTSREIKADIGLLEVPEGESIGFLARTERAAAGDFPVTDFLPEWVNHDLDLTVLYETRMQEVHQTGYGIFAKFRAFMVQEGALVPVKHPDPQMLSELYGYEREKEKIIKNTEALLAGKTCSNLLLYGDAGTGKSSTIKAVANKYSEEGLRIIEIRKEQLFEIPNLIEALNTVPLKFILFIDDLSFTQNDDNFSSLKAILEGSVSDKGDNIVVYATSNRRHLIKESMEDREGDDVHLSDTLQELSSLSARFGLTITFQRPDRDEYLAIVDELAKEHGLLLPQDLLHGRAEAFALRANGRTPRVAKQFVELQKIGIE